MTTLMKIKQSFVKGNPSFPKNSKEQKAGNFFVVNFKHRTDLYYHAYKFEHHYLDIQIKKARNKIGFLTLKQNRRLEELKQLKTKVSSVVFGTKNDLNLNLPWRSIRRTISNGNMIGRSHVIVK